MTPRNPSGLLAAALSVVLAPHAALAQAGSLNVVITEPTAGMVEPTGSTIRAEVTAPPGATATLIVNGASYPVPIQRDQDDQGTSGYVTGPLVASTGVNRVGVVVEYAGQVARDSVTYLRAGPGDELLVFLSWPDDGEIIDLWVREPDGETCKWDHRSTSSGGRLLDYSAAAIGLGSQAYASTRVLPGRYRIKLHYWESDWNDDWGDVWTETLGDDLQVSRSIEGLLEAAEQLERALARAPTEAARADVATRHAKILSAIDTWAEPHAIQTPVHATAVLFPGTRYERRYEFDRIMNRDGDLSSLGEIEIDPATLVRVRSAR
jgi:hypothetical protein